MNGWIILFAIIAFIVIVLGGNLFPGINTQVTGMSTANMGFIQIVIHRATPYAWLLAIPLGIYFLFKGKGGQAE